MPAPDAASTNADMRRPDLFNKLDPRFSNVMSCRKLKIAVLRHIVVEALRSCETDTRASIRLIKAPNFLDSAPGILPVRRSLLALVGINLITVRSQLDLRNASPFSPMIIAHKRSTVLAFDYRAQAFNRSRL